MSFRYESRTPDKKARVAVVLEKKIVGYTFEINSLDSGWTSGLVELKDKTLVTVPLHKRGENKFRVEVYDKGGDSVFLENDTIVITQTFANVDALLAAHSIGMEVKEKLGSNVSRLDYFVREGDTLPAKGQKKFRAGRKIRAGSDDSINFKIYQGEIEDRVEDNLFVGALKIFGDDFEFGTIVEGAEIICNYTIDDAGSINLEIEIPTINESFYKNFYSREEAQLNFDKAAGKLNSDGKNLLEQVRNLGRAIEDDDDYEKLQRAGEVASTAINVNPDCDREELKHIEEDLQAAKKILAGIRERNRENIRRENLDGLRDYYETYMKKFAEQQEISQLEKLFDRAENLIEREDLAFEDTVKEIISLSYGIVIRDNDFIIDSFISLTKNSNDYDDKASFNRLMQAGKNAIAQKDFAALREIFWDILDLGGNAQDEFLTANIIQS